MNRVPVKPALLRWACARSGRSAEELKEKDNFRKLDAWLNDDDETNPTFRQLEAFAKATYTPIGYFFLQEPPVEELPVTDYRTMGDVEVRRPSPDLLDTLYLCQRRQEWYHNEVRTAGEPLLELVGSLTTDDDIVSSAETIRNCLGFNIELRRQEATWTEAQRLFIGQVEASGILVMVNGVVGYNTHRKLDPEEFRGFALADPYAPLIFINGADSKAAQGFTLAHEVAHIWLGQSGVSNSRLASIPDRGIERWCNQVAAELLVPARLMRDEFDRAAELGAETSRLARHFKVSALVILRRMYDEGMLERDEFWSAWWTEVDRLPKAKKNGGGDFYRNAGPRSSKRFARALAVSTLEGRTTLKEAMSLLGFKNVSTFMNFAQTLSVDF